MSTLWPRPGRLAGAKGRSGPPPAASAARAARLWAGADPLAAALRHRGGGTALRLPPTASAFGRRPVALGPTDPKGVTETQISRGEGVPSIGRHSPASRLRHSALAWRVDKDKSGARQETMMAAAPRPTAVSTSRITSPLSRSRVGRPVERPRSLRIERPGPRRADEPPGGSGPRTTSAAPKLRQHLAQLSSLRSSVRSIDTDRPTASRPLSRPRSAQPGSMAHRLRWLRGRAWGRARRRRSTGGDSGAGTQGGAVVRVRPGRQRFSRCKASTAARAAAWSCHVELLAAYGVLFLRSRTRGVRRRSRRRLPPAGNAPGGTSKQPLDPERGECATMGAVDLAKVGDAEG